MVEPQALHELSLGSLLASVEERLESAVERISSGFPLIDAGLSGDVESGGFVLPSLVVLGAAPKAGKSTLAQIIAERHVNLGGNHWVYYVDLENGRERTFRRFIQRQAKLTGRDFKVGLSNDQRFRLSQAKFWMIAGPGQRFLLETKKPPSPREFSGKVMELKKWLPKGAKLLVVIDSLQKLRMDLSDRRAGVDEWLRELEELRAAARCVILTISELSRTQGAADYKTGTAKYKESGDIEYTCDLGLSMQFNKGRVVVSADFNRDGPIGPLCEMQPYFAVNDMQEKEYVKPERTKRNGKERSEAEE